MKLKIRFHDCKDYVRFAARDVVQPVTRRYPHVTVESELWKKRVDHSVFKRERCTRSFDLQTRNKWPQNGKRVFVLPI